MCCRDVARKERHQHQRQDENRRRAIKRGRPNRQTSSTTWCSTLDSLPGKSGIFVRPDCRNVTQQMLHSKRAGTTSVGRGGWSVVQGSVTPSDTFLAVSMKQRSNVSMSCLGCLQTGVVRRMQDKAITHLGNIPRAVGVYNSLMGIHRSLRTRSPWKYPRAVLTTPPNSNPWSRCNVTGQTGTHR